MLLELLRPKFMPQNQPNQDLLWKQYNLHVDLYKFYIDATIKINAFHYAITGAILSFYFAHAEEPLIKWSLVLPLVLSLGLGGLFIYGARLLEITREDVFSIRDKLHLDVSPEFKVLGVLLWILAVVQLLTAGAMSVLIWVR